MGLFTDGAPSSIEDLAAVDSQLLDIASIEGIDVSQKLRLAHEELGMQIYSLLRTFSCPDQTFWLQPKPNPATVVVTPPLKLWHTYRALEMFYADAYNSQLNDRYAGKRNQFHEQAKWAYEKLLQIGLGLVPLPVGRAVTPQVTATPGDALTSGTYYATMAWINRNGEEGAPSAPIDVNISANTFVVQPGQAPANATGWNVYAGTDPAALVQQNSSPMGLGESWQQYVPMATVGRTPGRGQEPNYVQAMPRVIQRG